MLLPFLNPAQNTWHFSLYTCNSFFHLFVCLKLWALLCLHAMLSSLQQSLGSPFLETRIYIEHYYLWATVSFSTFVVTFLLGFQSFVSGAWNGTLFSQLLWEQLSLSKNVVSPSLKDRPSLLPFCMLLHFIVGLQASLYFILITSLLSLQHPLSWLKFPLPFLDLREDISSAFSSVILCFCFGMTIITANFAPLCKWLKTSSYKSDPLSPFLFFLTWPSEMLQIPKSCLMLHKKR